MGQLRLGLALGAGGARGLAHIIMLQAIDELGARPSVIAGSSMGSIIGALYASGLSGDRIRTEIEDLLVTDHGRLREVLRKKDLSRLWEMIDPSFRKGGMLKGEGFVDYLSEIMPAKTFAELEIPLKVVATDFRGRCQVVFQEGPLLPAIRASMAMPWVFTPVVDGDRILMDGGVLNPVPFDLLWEESDLVVAVDVMGTRRLGEQGVPGFYEVIMGTANLMQAAIVKEKLKVKSPDVYVNLELGDLRVLDFHRAGEVLRMAEASRASFKESLAQVLRDSGWSGPDRP